MGRCTASCSEGPHCEERTADKWRRPRYEGSGDEKRASSQSQQRQCSGITIAAAVSTSWGASRAIAAIRWRQASG